MNPASFTILNVDDNEGARYAKTRILKLAGFKVLDAATGADALQTVRGQRPDLVLLDVKLPDINGLEVCRQIKSDPETASVLVLQTSAHLIGRVDRIRALEGGADNYLVAPIEAEELIANVNALLRLRQVREELTESELRFRQMAENIADVFWIFAPRDPQLLYVSPAYETIWGRSPEALGRDFFAWLDAVHEDDRPRVERAFRRLLGNEPYEEEYRVLRPDGSLRWVRDRAFPVSRNGDAFYRVARISSDITSRKAVEQILRETDRRKDEFLATLAHELRNPLAPLSNALELLQKPDAGERLKEQARAIMARQVTQMARLIDELLDISRISRGTIELQTERVELKTVIDNAIEIARPMIDQRQHALSVQLPPQPVTIEVDRTRAAQILSNLLNNAAKYTERGGRIRLEAALEDRQVVIRVRDNGIGIAPEMLPRIFEMFIQADRSFEQSQGGLGVGLTLAKRLVELHHGTLTVSSAGLGQGSEFVVSLPYEPEQPAATAPGGAAVPRPDQAGLRLLVVDDNVDAAESLADVLRLEGHEVATAYDGLQALERVERLAPDLALLDIGLPGLDGYELARRIRQLPVGRGMRLIALTGWGQQKDLDRSTEAGFDSHLVKPVDIAVLREHLAAIALRSASADPSPGAAEPDRTQDGDARRILIVDDSSAMQDSVSYLLKRDGYAIRTASDGLEALQVAQDWRPDFVFLDIRMPKLDGFEVARRLRAQFPPSSMKLILMSGLKLDDVLVRRARRIGFDECIDKISPPQQWYRLLEPDPQGGS